MKTINAGKNSNKIYFNLLHFIFTYHLKIYN